MKTIKCKTCKKDHEPHIRNGIISSRNCLKCIIKVNRIKKKKKLESEKLKRRKKSKEKRNKNRLWELCKLIIRKRDGNVCFICHQQGLVGSNWHTGHFLPRSTCGAYLKYDLRNLFSSCYNCNIHLGGNGAIFYTRIEEVFGKEFMDRIMEDRNVFIKADKIWFEKKVAEYEEVLKLDKEGLLNHTRNL